MKEINTQAFDFFLLVVLAIQYTHILLMCFCTCYDFYLIVSNLHSLDIQLRPDG